MTRSIHFFFAAFLLFSLSGCQSKTGDFKAIEAGFATPPNDVRTGVYWYWINDNISKEGVIKDLQAMKLAGIDRAYIGHIGESNRYPYGKIKMFTDEWWEVLHTAIKTAGELDIEIGLFNSPGWSQSGGPWIKPEQSMRYLASSEVRVKGPQKMSLKLEQPTDDFQDVKTLALPVPQGYRDNLFETSGAKITNKTMNLEADTCIGLILPQNAVARSLLIYPKGPFRADCEFQVKEGDAFRTIKSFPAHRDNLDVCIGFEPLAPVVISFPDVEAKEFRIVFHKINKGSTIQSLQLTSTYTMERFPEKTLAKMCPGNTPAWDYYMWDAQPANAPASIDKQQVQDITRFVADGTLTWEVPAGEWIIMRTGMASTKTLNGPASPEGTGLEVDKINKQHIQYHFDSYLGEIMKRIPEADRKSWKIIVEDSYERGGQNFTDGMLEEFTQRYGYDPVPFLPTLKGHVIDNPELSDRFLWDLRRLVADKVACDYVGGLSEVGHQYGLTTWLENYGHWGFPGEFLQYGAQSDEVAGEFWSWGNLVGTELKDAASCAHIYNKKRVWAESLTSGWEGYSRYPGDLKPRLDWSFTKGINATLLHVYIQQPYEDIYPGVDAWYGTEFNRKNTWFSHVDLFIKYIKRCNFMLQQGLDVADVAYYIGEDAPKMDGIQDPALPYGYNFDFINSEVIVRDLQVKNGRLVLPHGTSYRVLALPPSETIRPEVLQKIEQLVAAGAVVIGNPPSHSPSLENYPEADRQVQAMAAKMWGDPAAKQRQYGKGTIFTHTSLEEVFAQLKVLPDFRVETLRDSILYAHRSYQGSEIYFVTNLTKKKQQILPQFRVNGLQPELWNAVTGDIRSLPAYQQEGELTTVPIQLESLESTFLVFRKKAKPESADLAANYPQPQVITTVDTPWEVRFESDSAKRGPAEAVRFDALQDWTTHTDDRIRCYSGTAIYTTTLTLSNLPKDKKFYLDLGNVMVMAKVKINGQYIGGAWTAPYRVDATTALHEGENTLEVEVVSTYMNRIIGDKNLPKAERRIEPTQFPWKYYTPLQTSGLLGPVQVVALKAVSD